MYMHSFSVVVRIGSLYYRGLVTGKGRDIYDDLISSLSSYLLYHLKHPPLGFPSDALNPALIEAEIGTAT